MKAPLNVYHCIMVYNKNTSLPEKINARWIESVKATQKDCCEDMACEEIVFDASSSSSDIFSSSSDYSDNSR